MSTVNIPEINESYAEFKAPGALLHSIVQSSEDAIITKDLDGIITSWNPAAERIFGYTSKEIVGKSVLTLIPPSLHDEESDILAKLRAGKRIEHFETFRVTKDGKHLNVSLTISPLKDASGMIVGASKILRDIGERKQMENSLLLAEKIAAVGKMAAAVAHEINNPLESVLNLIYLAKTNVSDADQVVDYLNLAEKELLRVSHIARQTLGYYREHSAAIRIMLSDLILDTLKIYESKLMTAGIEVRTEFSSSSQIVVRKGELIQVISNFITNAIYAMPSGGTLTASVQDAVDSGREGLLVSIADTGEGIPAENLKKIFEPFFTTRNSIGTGIGLWVATEFIKGHKGTIEVQSSVDAASHGTRMVVFLPFDNPYAR